VNNIKGSVNFLVAKLNVVDNPAPKAANAFLVSAAFLFIASVTFSASTNLLTIGNLVISSNILPVKPAAFSIFLDISNCSFNCANCKSAFSIASDCTRNSS